MYLQSSKKLRVKKSQNKQQKQNIFVKKNPKLKKKYDEMK